MTGASASLRSERRRLNIQRSSHSQEQALMSLNRRSILTGVAATSALALGGIHQTYLSGVESRKRNPSVLVLDRISKALGVDAMDLFKRHRRA
jgi:transcriptional regulator with XRE-family HTH domain